MSSTLGAPGGGVLTSEPFFVMGGARLKHRAASAQKVNVKEHALRCLVCCFVLFFFFFLHVWAALAAARQRGKNAGQKNQDFWQGEVGNCRAAGDGGGLRALPQGGGSSGRQIVNT